MKIKLLTFLLGFAFFVNADSSLSFGVTSPSRDIDLWWSSGDDSSTGQNIWVSAVFDSLAGHACFSCNLVLNLGSFQTSTDTSWIFAPDGLFVLFGGADLMDNGDPAADGNIPETLPGGTMSTLAAGAFTDSPSVTLMSYNPLVDESILRFDAMLNGTLNPLLADFFGFTGSATGSVFLDFTVPHSITPGQSFEADTLLGGTLTFNNLPQTP